MSREPIDFADIRVGDTVEREVSYRNGRVTIDRLTVDKHYDDCLWHGSFPLTQRADATWFLLHRPAPAVVLPETPTLGWATWDDGPCLAVWKKRAGNLVAVDSTGDAEGLVDEATAFTPATAVPTDALDALRGVARNFCPSGTAAAIAIRTFLAATDEANA